MVKLYGIVYSRYLHVINNDNGEYSIPNSRYHADGYSENKNLILEYHGDYWHGNPKIYIIQKK